MQQSLKIFIQHYHDDDWILPGHGTYAKFSEIKNHNQYIKNII
jgi:hypothetical protein